MSVLKVHAGVVGQLAALLVPGAGHSADAEVVQDAAAAPQQPSGLEILGCWAGHTVSVPAGWGEVEHGKGHQRTLHPLIELSTNLRESEKIQWPEK